MKSKIILKCMDGQKEYEYSKATIYTRKYTVKLTKSSLHSPRAAKIIFTNLPSQFVLLLKMPIIHVDHIGTITIFSKSTLDEATLKEKYELSPIRVAETRAQSKLLNNKRSLGLTKREALLNNMVSYEEEMIYLIRQLGSYKEGGGFND